MPPLTITHEELERGLDIFEESLEAALESSEAMPAKRQEVLS